MISLRAATVAGRPPSCASRRRIRERWPLISGLRLPPLTPRPPLRTAGPSCSPLRLSEALQGACRATVDAGAGIGPPAWYDASGGRLWRR